MVRLRLMMFEGLVACLTASAHAQCGVTMSCAEKPLAVCKVDGCFVSETAKKQYESDNNCFFVDDALCAGKSLDKTTQCCVKDSVGKVKAIDKQIKTADPKFDWEDYQRQCPKMHQSEASPDGLWSQCVVGKVQDPKNDDWPIILVQPNPSSAKARPYCIDGCSTPRRAVNVLFSTGIFLVADKDNPSGYPGASFVRACSAHDICYQTCSADSNQETCDDRLLAESLRACGTIPREHESINSAGKPKNTRDACVNAANKMSTGLYFGGKAAFLKRKQQYCQCC